MMCHQTQCWLPHNHNEPWMQQQGAIDAGDVGKQTTVERAGEVDTKIPSVELQGPARPCSPSQRHK